MPEQQKPSIQAIVDLLHRRSPAALGELREKYTAYEASLVPGKHLGVESPPPEEMLKDLARASISAATEEGLSLSQKIRHKISVSSRLRLAGSLISSVSSASLVAALFRDATRAALAGGVVALVSSSFTLVAQYVEDFAGGQKSLREFREQVIAQVTETQQVESDFKLMVALQDFSQLEALIRKLNVAVASIRQIQLSVE
jgi:hypothetical protein